MAEIRPLVQVKTEEHDDCLEIVQDGDAFEVKREIEQVLNGAATQNMILAAPNSSISDARPAAAVNALPPLKKPRHQVDLTEELKTCVVCRLEFDSIVQNPKSICWKCSRKYEKNRWPCAYCTTSLGSAHTLRTHEKHQHGAGIEYFVCQHCDQRYFTPMTNRWNHLRYCQQGFSARQIQAKYNQERALEQKFSSTENTTLNPDQSRSKCDNTDKSITDNPIAINSISDTKKTDQNNRLERQSINIVSMDAGIDLEGANTNRMLISGINQLLNSSVKNVQSIETTLFVAEPENEANSRKRSSTAKSKMKNQAKSERTNDECSKAESEAKYLIERVKLEPMVWKYSDARRIEQRDAWRRVTDQMNIYTDRTDNVSRIQTMWKSVKKEFKDRLADELAFLKDGERYVQE